MGDSEGEEARGRHRQVQQLTAVLGEVSERPEERRRRWNRRRRRMSVRRGTASISLSRAPELDSCEEKGQRETAVPMVCSARLGDGCNGDGERRRASG